MNDKNKEPQLLDCPHCGTSLTPPEIKANECWDCGHTWPAAPANDADKAPG